MNAAFTLQGQFLDGHRPVGIPTTFIFGGRQATLIGTEISRSYSVPQMRVSPRIAGADRFIALPDGGQFQCADQPALDRLPQQSPAEGVVAWLEQRWGVALAGVVLIVMFLGAGYFYGLPAAAKYAAMKIPIETEQALGKQTLEWLDRNQWFKPTQLAPDLQERIRNEFSDLTKGLPLEARIALEFRNSEVIGPNAFALPGGTIVITDRMISLAQSPDEVLAVLAHEIGHVELRHTVRNLLQNSAVAVVAATLTADAATLSVAVAGLPVVLAQTKYSREFEGEADEYAFELLKRHDISPEAFASLMERLSGGKDSDANPYGFLSTHPVTAERVQRARAAAQP